MKTHNNLEAAGQLTGYLASIAPENPRLLADSLMNDCRMDEGEIRRLLDMNSEATDIAVAANSLGVFLWKEKRFAEAIMVFQAALSKFPQSVILRSNLGINLAEIGEKDKAIVAFKTALKHDPCYSLAQGHLKALTSNKKASKTAERIRVAISPCGNT